MKFRTAYDIGERFISSCGSRYKKKFIRKVDIGGKKSLEDAGSEDVYAQIQLAAHGTLVNDLVSRALNGDRSAILPSEGVITDLTTMPTSLIDAHNKICLARSTFESLPVEVRQDFGNSFDKFMKAVQDGSFTSEYKLTNVSTPRPSAVEQKLEEIKKVLEGGSKNE